ncbi:hypothetical protein PVAP13_3KG206043 [Panicum virgatum]|uniref:SIT4 phosphatase-associated family protein n=1 Tax=Panicum virgatum TaxID=38727 RepID=A0A8T0USQ8_PANVG|nr:hypothetical protein PVAP13_3KG206043 [Panicum virgatum]
MFWRMTGLSAASPVDTILDKENFTLEELLDEDEIIQECKALNTRLINFLRDKSQVEQLLRYIVEDVPEDSEKKRSFKFPFIACEIFTCEIDIILRTLVEDVELMDLLFSFVKPDHPHSTLLAGYFSKVVICLMLRKTAPLMNYVQEHPDIVVQLVDLIGITSIMEVLMRLIGADETIYSNFADTLQWLESTDVLEMIVDKFSSSDSPEVHANAAEILSAVTRCAPPALAAKICSPSFVGRLFRHALEESRPKSVLVHSLSVCISLLDPKRLASASYQAFRSNLSHGTLVTASPETVDGMLESLGALLKLLDITSSENVLPTTYGCLRPPLGKHRLKVKRNQLIDHVLNDCGLVGKVLAAEKKSSLSVDSNGPTLPSEGKDPPRIGNMGHITRIANKLIQLANSSSMIQNHLLENSEWSEWQTSVLVKRNEVENVYHWACGRPTSLHDRGRDSDDDDFRDRDYDVAALANNLSQAFRYGMYSNDDIEEAQGSHERDDEDVYFDDESAEVVISSLRLGDDQDSSSLFTNSNWFTFDGDRGINDRLAASVPSPSPNSEETSLNMEETDEVLIGEATGTESQLESVSLENGSVENTKELAGVAEQNGASADDEKLLCTEEENFSQEAEASEQPMDVQDGQTDTQGGDAAEASSTEGAADEPCSSPEPGHALTGALSESFDTDHQSANTSGSNEIAHESGLPVKVDDGKIVEVATTNE